ncbi:MAG: hypothetical protein H6807_11360 [Planctomycetes bacterium]|nr:hypothetical protein [Planctomycetota bacterium]
MRPHHALLALVLLSSTISGQITVNGSGSFSTIQLAIDAAPNGATIDLPPGTYVENLHIVGKHLAIQGSGPGVTFIDGSGAQDRCIEILDPGAGRTTLRDLTIENGSAFPFSTPTTGLRSYGGGVYAWMSLDFTPFTISLENCVVRNCSAGIGAGIAAYGSPTTPVKLEVAHSTIRDNLPKPNSGILAGTPQGIGILCQEGAEITDSVFQNNRGDSTPFVTSTLAGGLDIFPTDVGNTAPPVTTLIDNCTFDGNVTNDGSAILGVVKNIVRIENCRFTNNLAEKTTINLEGLGTAHPQGAMVELRNCLIVRNYCDPAWPFSRILDLDHLRGLDIRNCTVTSNTCREALFTRPLFYQPGGGATQIANSIFSNNFIGNLTIDGIDPLSIGVSYSLLEGGQVGGGVLPPSGLVNVLDLDPAFVDPLAGDFRLRPGSPCVDSGSPSLSPAPFDIDGNPRTAGAQVDMGCFELQMLDPGADFGGTGAASGVLKFNASTGGVNRSVAVDAGSTCTLSVDAPTPGIMSPFILWGYLGVPGSGDSFAIDFAGGNMAFTPHLVDLGNALLFTFSNNLLTPNSGLIFSTPAPWSITGPCAPFPITMTLQGLIADGTGPLEITNAITLHAR